MNSQAAFMILMNLLRSASLIAPYISLTQKEGQEYMDEINRLDMSMRERSKSVIVQEELYRKNKEQQATEQKAKELESAEEKAQVRKTAAELEQKADENVGAKKK